MQVDTQVQYYRTVFNPDKFIQHTRQVNTRKNQEYLRFIKRN